MTIMRSGEHRTLRAELEREAGRMREPMSDDVLSGFNEDQLWTIYIGLDGLKLAEPLQSAAAMMAQQVHNYGRSGYGWL